jgi:adenylate cyclase
MMAVMKLSNAQRYVLLALILFICLLAEVLWLKALAPLEHRLSDRMLLTHALNSKPDTDIVIVDIDERSLALMADSVGRWPWPRSLHAELVEGISAQKPRAIIFDILFSDADMARPEDDKYFADVIASHDGLYFPMMKLSGSGDMDGIPLSQFGAQLGITASPQANPDARVAMVLPLAAMLETRRVGTHNAVPDEDGVVRSYPRYTDVEGWHIPSLPAKVAEGLGFNSAGGTQKIHLNWHGHALSYPRVSYADVYQDFQRKQSERSAGEFTNKIVIVGATANGLNDIRATPIDGLYPGVEILATAIDNLKNANPLQLASPIVAVALGALLLMGLARAFVTYCYLMRIGAVLALLTIAILLGAYYALSLKLIIWILTPLLFAWLYFLAASLLEYWSERKKRMLAMATFGRFLDPRVVQALVDRGETTQSLSGKSREISVLFSDIRGFTSLSERSTPEQVVELLNAYFTQQAAVIFAQDGTLDKYIGDAIMAFWGAPVNQPDHALKAVTAALQMSAQLEQFRSQAGELGRDLEIGIGVHSGPAVVGFIGSETKQDYTAIGDTVNLASRIEGQTKGIARVLVSEDTKRMCEEQAGDACPFEFLDCGSYEVKGRAQSVRLFEPRLLIA